LFDKLREFGEIIAFQRKSPKFQVKVAYQSRKIIKPVEAYTLKEERLNK
jgi:hypothetical protein